MRSSVPSITAAGEAAVCSKTARAVVHIVGSTSRMRASEPIARSSIQNADSQMRAIARNAGMMPSEPKPVKIAFPPASAPRSASFFRHRCASCRSARSAR
eukprot:5575590-Pleurochrysis_carterae.AAC.1